MNTTTSLSPLIHKNSEFLRTFHSKSRSKRAQAALIERATDEQLLCFVEICFNVLKGRVPLRKAHLRKLCSLRQQLRRLARARCARSTRNILLNSQTPQKGSGLPAVAGVLASILIPLVAEKFIHK